MNNIQIIGPEELRKVQALGLRFPEKEPEFKTAFIIMPQEEDIPKIPDWAIGRMVSRDDLEEA